MLTLTLPKPPSARVLLSKGGEGSGHHGHGGRPGKRGGSAAVGGTPKTRRWGQHTIYDIARGQKLPDKALEKDGIFLIRSDGSAAAVLGAQANKRLHADLADKMKISNEEYDEVGRWQTFTDRDKRVFNISTTSSGVGRSHIFDLPAKDRAAEKLIVKQAKVLRDLGYPDDAEVRWRPVATRKTISTPLGEWKAEYGIVVTLGELIERGGAGSGHHGHGGRPGKRGGSAAGGSAASLRAISTEEEASAWAGQHFTSWRGGLSDDQVMHLEEYSAEMYEYINGYLDGTSFTRWTSLDVSIESISSAMTSLPESVVVHRRIDESLGGKVGDQFVDKSFVSTALSESYSQELLSEGPGNMLRIEVPKGTKVAYLGNIGDIESISYVAQETELLLDKGLRFEVTAVGDVPTIRVVP